MSKKHLKEGHPKESFDYSTLKRECEAEGEIDDQIRAAWILEADPNSKVWCLGQWDEYACGLIWGTRSRWMLEEKSNEKIKDIQSTVGVQRYEDKVWENVKVFRVKDVGWCVEALEKIESKVDRLWLNEQLQISCASFPAVQFKKEQKKVIGEKKRVINASNSDAEELLEEWFLNGKSHRENGPAVIWKNGSWAWMRHGVLHRADAPAVFKVARSADSTRWEWIEHGALHRINGPALLWEDGSYQWYVKGVLHRINGPAVCYADGRTNWVKNGKLHRALGPADYVQKDKVANPRWFYEGVEYKKEEHPGEHSKIEYEKLSKSVGQSAKNARRVGKVIGEVFKMLTLKVCQKIGNENQKDNACQMCDGDRIKTKKEKLSKGDRVKRL